MEDSASEHQLLIASVVLREGAEIQGTLLDKIFAECAEEARPSRVLVVAALPMSDGFRPIKSFLRDDGLPDLEDSLQTYLYNPTRSRYEEL